MLQRLTFKGKSAAAGFHFAVPILPFTPRVAGSSPGAPLTTHSHVLLEGDELRAMKALLPDVAGGFDCIYASPNYNTGATKDSWRYLDDIPAEPMVTWASSTAPVSRDDLERHEKWLCMMLPRLRLMHSLLMPSGVLLVSIDDNELFHLRFLLDEVFGAENFLGNLVWEKRYSPAPDAPIVGYTHECVLAFRKTAAAQVDSSTPRMLSRTAVGDTDEAAKELRTLLPRASANVKPIRLLAHLLRTFAPSNARILVPFDDGGTAALAVMHLNAADAGTRRCVVIGPLVAGLTHSRILAAQKREVVPEGHVTSSLIVSRLAALPLYEPAPADGGLPGSGDLARHLYYIATGTLEGLLPLASESGRIGASAEVLVYMLYRPEVAWLASRSAGLDIGTAERIVADAAGRPAVVFGSTSFVARERLVAMGLEFALFPATVFAMANAAGKLGTGAHADA